MFTMFTCSWRLHLKTTVLRQRPRVAQVDATGGPLAVVARGIPKSDSESVSESSFTSTGISSSDSSKFCPFSRSQFSREPMSCPKAEANPLANPVPPTPGRIPAPAAPHDAAWRVAQEQRSPKGDKSHPA